MNIILSAALDTSDDETYIGRCLSLLLLVECGADASNKTSEHTHVKE